MMNEKAKQILFDQRRSRQLIGESLSPTHIDRRDFVRLASRATIGVSLAHTISPLANAWQTADASGFVPGKDHRLIVHNTNPGVLETPLELLRAHRVTPKEILFLRNNQFLPGSFTLEPIPLDGWTIEIMGLVKAARTTSAADLTKMEQVEVESVMQCSGNGRSLYAQTARTRGEQWKKGAIGNVRWRGVLLKTVLEQAEVETHPDAKFLTAEGKDGPPAPKAPDFEHSLPLPDVLNKAILALEMNGEPIPAVHGGPVRLIIPGYYGTMNIKWLHRLRLETHESINYNHFPRYRTFVNPIEPGSNPEPTLENTLPNWHQKIKSIIWSPLDGETVRAGFIEVSGVAWNDGRVKIDAVDVSTDGGQSWQRTELQAAASPYAWYPWKATVRLSPGQPQIWSRAVDALGRSQPLDGSIHWNPSGYEWNGIDKVTVTVS